MISHRAPLPLLLAALLLWAQLAALTHAVWHGAAHGAPAVEAAPGAGHDHEPQPAQRSLCDLHLALDQLLGAAGGPAAFTLPTGTQSGYLAGTEPAWRDRAAVSPQSRGPPALSLIARAVVRRNQCRSDPFRA